MSHIIVTLLQFCKVEKMNHVACLLGIFLSFSALANNLNCERLIVDKFESARGLYITEANIHKIGYQNSRLASWKVEVDDLNSKCANEAVKLPFDRQIYAADLYSLMQSYITGKGLEEWQAKFTLALVCNKTPSACERYIVKQTYTEDAELGALWDSVVN